MLNNLPRATLDLLLLRRGPQDLPARQNLLYSVMAAYVLITALAYLSVIQMSAANAALQSASSLAYLAGFVWMVLAMAGRRARFLQSFMAMSLTAIVFNILEVGPLIKLMPYLQEIQALMAQAQATGKPIEPAAVESLDVPGFSMVLLLVVYAWRLMVMAHIFHHALEISRGRAMGLALLYPAVIMLLVMILR